MSIVTISLRKQVTHRSACIRIDRGRVLNVEDVQELCDLSSKARSNRINSFSDQRSDGVISRINVSMLSGSDTFAFACVYWGNPSRFSAVAS